MLAARHDDDDIYIYIYIYIRGSLNKFPDFFRMGTFIDSTAPFKVISSGCIALVVPFQQLLEGPMEVLLCHSKTDARFKQDVPKAD